MAKPRFGCRKCGKEVKYKSNDETLTCCGITEARPDIAKAKWAETHCSDCGGKRVGNPDGYFIKKCYCPDARIEEMEAAGDFDEQ